MSEICIQDQNQHQFPEEGETWVEFRASLEIRPGLGWLSLGKEAG